MLLGATEPKRLGTARRLQPFRYGLGRRCGVGRSLGIGLPLGVGVGRGVEVGVGVAVGVGDGVPHGVSMYARNSFCGGEAGGHMQKSSV